MLLPSVPPEMLWPKLYATKDKEQRQSTEPKKTQSKYM